MVTLISDSAPHCHIGVWLKIKYKEVLDCAFPFLVHDIK